MICIRITRTEADGTQTDLGEVRFPELFAPVAAYRETPVGAGIVRHVRRLLDADADAKPVDTHLAKAERTLAAETRRARSGMRSY